MYSYLRRHRQCLFVMFAGAVIGAGATLLSYWGNPRNAGFCSFIFLRDTAGALGFHGAPNFAYLRPEIMAIVVGAWLSALCGREFRARSAQAAPTRFMGGLVMIVGAAVVIGCPVRMLLRLGSGDWPAVVALAGLLGGVWLGTLYLRAGFSLGPAKPARTFHALILPLGMLALLLAGSVHAPFLLASEVGAGARHAPSFLSLGIGLFIGVVAQRSRLCVTGALQNFVLARERTLLWGLVALLGSVVMTSALTGQFEFTAHGVSAHSEHVWNLLGMALVGFGAMLVGGCPLRQLILSGEGDVDAGLAVAGMVFGVALCENLGLASSSAGTTHYGRIAVLLGFIFLLQAAMSLREE